MIKRALESKGDAAPVPGLPSGPSGRPPRSAWTILTRMSGRWLGVCSSLLLAAAACGHSYVDPAEPARAPKDEAPASTREAPLSELDALEHELSLDEERLAGYLAGRGSELRAESAGEETVARSDDAESDLQRAPGREFSHPPAKSKRAQRPADGASGAPAPAAAAPPPPVAAAAEPAPEPGAGSACDLACRALSSMRRSAERICSIAGDGDPRCSRARARVEDAIGRMSRASCACRESN